MRHGDQVKYNFCSDCSSDFSDFEPDFCTNVSADVVSSNVGTNKCNSCTNCSADYASSNYSDVFTNNAVPHT